jgi:hypothetical protein
LNGGAPELDEKMDGIAASKGARDQMGGKENQGAGNSMLPPRTPNYGKTPKYISQYQEEAKIQKELKEEQRLAKLRPPGTRLLQESERVSTLEQLMSNKKELTTVLMQLPISLRTESLKAQKVQLEQKLQELDKAIETFSKKAVYVKV